MSSTFKFLAKTPSLEYAKDFQISVSSFLVLTQGGSESLFGTLLAVREVLLQTETADPVGTATQPWFPLSAFTAQTH